MRTSTLSCFLPGKFQSRDMMTKTFCVRVSAPPVRFIPFCALVSHLFHFLSTFVRTGLEAATDVTSSPRLSDDTPPPT
jgi:hypothetical protein